MSYAVASRVCSRKSVLAIVTNSFDGCDCCRYTWMREQKHKVFINDSLGSRRRHWTKGHPHSCTSACFDHSEVLNADFGVVVGGIIATRSDDLLKCPSFGSRCWQLRRRGKKRREESTWKILDWSPKKRFDESQKYRKISPDDSARRTSLDTSNR